MQKVQIFLKNSASRNQLSQNPKKKWHNFGNFIWTTTKYPMNKKYKTAIKIAVGAVLLALTFLFFERYSTKAYSPEETVVYQEEDLKLEVFYNRPYKKGRLIFGELVPYGEVWRTGANEATTFETNQDLLVDGSLLEAGKYTLWTIPGEKSWKIIFNAAMYPWGIDADKKAYRDPTYDKLVLEVPVKQNPESLEQFSIYFESANDFIMMNLAWDKVVIQVPLKTTKET